MNKTATKKTTQIEQEMWDDITRATKDKLVLRHVEFDGWHDIIDEIWRGLDDHKLDER